MKRYGSGVNLEIALTAEYVVFSFCSDSYLLHALNARVFYNVLNRMVLKILALSVMLRGYV
jgi:hypothetical protein